MEFPEGVKATTLEQPREAVGLAVRRVDFVRSIESLTLKTRDTAKLYELGANPYLIRRVFRRRFAI